MTDKSKLTGDSAKLTPQVRFLRIDTGADANKVDEVNRTVTFSFSSETPVPRWYGDEILSHQKGCADLTRINTSGPLLFNHDLDDLLGVVEKAWVGDDKRGYCTVRFGKDERGDWAMKQVQDRILQNVSFMYRINVYEHDTETDTYTATDWEVYEVSLVTVPADTSIGVGRSETKAERNVVIRRSAPTNQSTEQTNERTRMTTPTTETTAPTTAPAQPAIDPAKVEKERVAEIEAMCKAHKIPDETRNLLITLHQPIEAARGIVLNHVLARNQGAASLGGSYNPDLTEREKARYNMLRAINAATNERMGYANAWEKAGFEREVSNEIAKRTGKSSGGLFIPTNLQFAMKTEERAANYSVGTGVGLSPNSGGANLVATDLLEGEFIDLLRNKCRVMTLGARVLSGLVGNIDIPRQKAAGRHYWVGEGQTLPDTGARFEKVTMTPKNVGAITGITRTMMQQSTPSVEMLARADLLATIALGIDAAALYGSGTNSEPLGISNQAGVGSVIGGADGAAISFDHLIDLETKVAAANADVDGMAYLANAVTVGSLKKLKSTTGQYLWTNTPTGQRGGTPGEINGYAVARSNQARSNLTKGTGVNLSEIYFGDWSQLLVAEWGVIELLVNPFAAGYYETGGVEVRVLQTVDIALRHVESFAVMSDAKTS